MLSVDHSTLAGSTVLIARVVTTLPFFTSPVSTPFHGRTERRKTTRNILDLAKGGRMLVLNQFAARVDSSS